MSKEHYGVNVDYQTLGIDNYKFKLLERWLKQGKDVRVLMPLGRTPFYNLPRKVVSCEKCGREMRQLRSYTCACTNEKCPQYGDIVGKISKDILTTTDNALKKYYY